MTEKDNTLKKGGLGTHFTPLGIWAISIGTSIGWGSFIVTCNTYLQKSGLLGTIFGLLLGMAVIFVITWNLQYMIQNSPDAGGIYTFEKKISGKDFGFLAYWFVLLTYLAILWANMTAVPLFARFFLGHTFQIGFHYQIFGYEVWLGEALLSICAVILIALLCIRSSKLLNRIMIAAALIFVIGFTVCAVISIIHHDGAFSYEPMYTEGSGAFAQIIRIAAISPWAFIGFENISHFSEEYCFPLKKVKGILIGSVLVTTVLYLFVSILSVSAYPGEYSSWLAYIRDMGNLDGIKAVPAFFAANHYLGKTGVTVLMLALFAVILTSLIGNMIALSRLLYAAGREREAPESLSHLNEAGVPDRAVLAVLAISVLIPFLGRTAIGWIVDVTTLGATLIYGLISHAVIIHAKANGNRMEKLSGIAGLVLMMVFVILLLVPGLLPFDAMETESYILFIVWSVLGLYYFRKLIRRDESREYGSSLVVWVILLILVLFASMMWVSRATENAANEAVMRIYEYHESHPDDDSIASVREDRVAFLQEQAKAVSKTNTLYSAASLSLFVLFMALLLENYRDTRKLGERLSAAEREAIAAKKIAELKQSVGVLLDNMPALSFSKDAKTGVYLACNQAFAEYANRPSPDQVTGLTDFDIFDQETARHFTEDDRKALLMDEPYIFFEDVMDAEGNARQFQTTKMKFYDTSGRLCLLGMCMDVTETERIRKETEQAKAAYQEVLTTSAIYENIVDALSEDYFNLFYVDTETGDYIEYGSRTEEGKRATERRGSDFFSEARRNAPIVIYEEDQDRVIEAIDRENLLDAIDKHGAYVFHYRLLINGEPVYVSMKATRIPGDEKHIIIGVNNVDTQVKDRMAAERAAEEKKSYLRLSALNSNLIVLYYVDLETNQYTEFSSSEGYHQLGIASTGNNFFETAYENSLRTVHPEDQNLFHSQASKENILSTIEQDGVFLLDYRLLNGDLPTYVRLKAAKVEEDGKEYLIVGLLDEDAQIRHEQEYAHNLSVARKMASVDALTGVKNKYAYVQWEEKINAKIEKGEQEPFAVVVCDINNMKAVNDLYGHKEGDACIKRACARICGIFAHSPVFRTGGDEFVVILTGDDYSQRHKLMERINAVPENRSQQRIGDIISAGMVEYCKDQHFSLLSVFEAADMKMYERKQMLKSSYIPGAKEMVKPDVQEAEEKYEYDPEERSVLTSLSVPFAVYQFINRRVVTLILSEGFCEMFGYEDRLMAYLDMDHDMYKDTHPEDVERIAAEAVRFATEGGEYDVTYRTKIPGTSRYHIVHAIGRHVYTSTGVRLAQVWYTDEGEENRT